MRRAPLVIAGTVAGVAGVLAFPTHRPRLVIPTQSATGNSTTPAGTGAQASPTTGAPGASGASGGSSSPGGSSSAGSTSASRQATGADTPYPYGDLAVEVKVTGTHITDVVLTRLNDGGGGQSAFIDQQAIPLLRQQVLAAQSTNISGVSGATYTSQAYVDSVQSALDQLGIK